MRKRITAMVLLCALLLSGMMVPGKQVQAKTKTHVMRVGDKARLIYEYNGKTISASKVHYRVSKKGIVSVSKKGVIKAKKVGKVTVTGTYKNTYTKWYIKVKKKKKVDSYVHTVNNARYRVPKSLKLSGEVTNVNRTISNFANKQQTRGLMVVFEDGSFTNEELETYRNRYNEKGGALEQNIRKAVTNAGKDGANATIEVKATKKGKVVTTHCVVTTPDGYYDETYILHFNKGGKKVVVTSTSVNKNVKKVLKQAKVVMDSFS